MSTAKQPRAIAWGDGVDVPRRPHTTPILSVRPGDDHCVGIMLDTQWHRVWQHCWPPEKKGDSRRPSPHWTPKEACEGCTILRQRPRAKYYAGVFMLATSRIVLFELTEGVPDLCPLVIDKHYNWRGMRVRPFRLTKDKRSRMSLEVGKERLDSSKLPPAPDIRPSLEVMWGLMPNTIAGFEDVEGGAA